MTIGDQVTNTLCELLQTWCLLESYEISKTAIRQNAQYPTYSQPNTHNNFDMAQKHQTTYTSKMDL